MIGLRSECPKESSMMRRLRGYNWKKLILISLLSSLAQPIQMAAQQKTILRLGTLAPRDTSYHHILQEMGTAWEHQTNGGVTLKIYPDGTMGGETAMVQRMRVGQLQAAMLTVGGISEIDPAIGALQKMPLVYRSLEEAEYVRNKLRPELEKRLADKGFIVLFWADAGWVRFYSKDPAMRPDDFKRTKMMVTAGDNSQVEIMKKLGMRPVSLEWSDTLTGLQTGLVDAVPTVPFHALAGQFYLVTHNMLEVNWVPLVGATLMTKKSWDALPEETRNAMRATAEQAGGKIQARSRQENDEAVVAMQKHGLQVHAITPELAELWAHLGETIKPEVRGEIVPADMFDRVQQLVAEYRKSQSGNGK
jgi:TRAP-type C4-dicarboxylate transport system substrate-binding protein